MKALALPYFLTIFLVSSCFFGDDDDNKKGGTPGGGGGFPPSWVISEKLLSLGSSHSCVVDGGKVRCWGKGTDGRLGNDQSTLNKDHPVVVVRGDSTTDALLNIKRVSSGEEHSCGLNSSGEILCWGKGAYGRLGNASTDSKDHPVKVVGSDDTDDALEDMVAVSSGNEHSCGLDDDGEVSCWGRGADGRLGNNATEDTTSAVKVVDVDSTSESLEDIAQISAGGKHNCALGEKGNIFCWGDGLYGQLGNNATADKKMPVMVMAVDDSGDDLDDMVQVSSGLNHTCALNDDKKVLCWGRGNKGQLGDDSTNDRYMPVFVVDTSGSTTHLSGVVQIVAGAQHTCALKSNGRVMCWGYGVSGQLGEDATRDRMYPVEVINEDNTGDDPLTNIIELSAGDSHTCALNNRGNIFCWGAGTEGRLGNDLSTTQMRPVAVVEDEKLNYHFASGIRLNNHSQISAGMDHTCQIKEDGYAYCWGKGDEGQLGNADTSPSTLPVSVLDEDNSDNAQAGLIEISAGEKHTCALKSDSGVLCWGYGSSGQLGNGGTGNKTYPVPVMNGESTPDELLGVQHVAVGKHHSCVIDKDGRVLCWGEGSDGQLGNGTNVDRSYSSHVIAANGVTNPLTGAVQIAAGDLHTCALKEAGHIYCWGEGDGGRLGDDASADRNYPVLVRDGDTSLDILDDVVQVAAGGEHSCALVGDGKVFCWGRGGNGRLGNDTTSDVTHAVAVSSVDSSSTPLSGIVQISLGSVHSCALEDSGKVLCWGEGVDGRLGTGNTDEQMRPAYVIEGTGTNHLTDVVQIDAGVEHTCALKHNGESVCWGKGEDGRLGEGANSTREYAVNVQKGSDDLEIKISALSAGQGHACALVSGKVRCWGHGTSGQLGDDGDNDQKAPVAAKDSDGNELAKVKSLGAGSAHTCAVRSDGKVECWGEGSSGQLGNNESNDQSKAVVVEDASGNELTGAVGVSSGGEHSCLVNSEGRVYCWGKGTNGRLGNKANSDSDSPVVLVDATGDIKEKMVQVSAGEEHSCALTSHGKVFCWGKGLNGRLGHRATEDSSSASFVRDATGDALEIFTQVSVGGEHSCGVLATGNGVCWGKGTDGRLGNNASVDKNTPVPIMDDGSDLIPDVIQVSAGDAHACALQSNRQVQCWGKGTDGQLGNGGSSSSDNGETVLTAASTPLKGVVYISAGEDSTCALRAAGDIYCWGKGDNQRLGNDDGSADALYAARVLPKGWTGTPKLTVVVP